MAADGKYGIITTERKQFHPGEPVFILRATDRDAPGAILDYRARCINDGCSGEHCNAILAHHDRIVAWQKENPSLVKRPD